MNIKQRLNKEQRKAQVIELVLEGLSYRQIRDETGFSIGVVSKYVNEALEEAKETTKSGIERIKRLEVMRLDRLLRSVWPKAIGKESGTPDMQAVQTSLKVMERRSELLGLDAPRKLKMADFTSAELIDALSELADEQGESYFDPQS